MMAETELSSPSKTLPEALGEAFIEGDYLSIQKALATQRPLHAAAIAVSVISFLPPDEQENYIALIRRIGA